MRRGEELPLLHGLPTGIKDLEETKDLLTTYGSPLYRDFVPTWDNVMVGRVRAAGAVVVGKTNVPEFGAGSNSRNPVWGATGNPFNPMLNPGGSSGGSAVALATDMLPVCTGSDTGGSLRNPAAVLRRRGLPPLARHGRGRAPRHGLDADLGAGPDGPHASPTSACSTPRRSASTIPIRCPSRSSGDAFAEPWPVDLGSLQRGLDRGLRRRAGREGHPRRPSRAKIKAMKHLFRRLDKVEVDYGDADRCFDVIRAVNFLSRYQRRLHQERKMLGPNILRQLRDRRQADARRLRLGACRADAHLPQVPGALPDYDLVIGPTVGFTPFPWKQLYVDEMEGKKLRNYYHWMATNYFDHAGHQSGDRRCPAASTTRRCRSACR